MPARCDWNNPDQPKARRWSVGGCWWLAIAGVLLAACTTTGASVSPNTGPLSSDTTHARVEDIPPDSSLAAFHVPDPNQLDELNDDDLVLPTAALSLAGFSSSDQLMNHIDELVASCMQQRGWTYLPPVRKEPVSQPLTVGELKEFTAEYGYGMWTLPVGNNTDLERVNQQNQEYMASLSSEEKERYERDLGDQPDVPGSGTDVLRGSCRAEAQAATGSANFNTAALREGSQLYVAAMNSPEMANLKRDYADCIHALGYEFDQPKDLQMMAFEQGFDMSPEERVPFELKIAGDDIKCRLETRTAYEIAVGEAIVAYLIERYPELAQWAPEQ